MTTISNTVVDNTVTKGIVQRSAHCHYHGCDMY